MTCKNDVLFIFIQFQKYVELIQFKHKVVFLIISHVYTLSNKMVLFSINITIQYKQVLLYLPTPIFLFIFGMMLFKIACYLINFILIPTLQNTYSFELLFHTFPNYSFLWVFSYACFSSKFLWVFNVFFLVIA